MHGRRGSSSASLDRRQHDDAEALMIENRALLNNDESKDDLMQSANTGRVPDGKASLEGSIVNVANSVVGAGMLSLPYVLRESSFVWGLAVIVFTCGLSMYSFYILGVACELTGRFDYKGLGAEAGGPRFAALIQVVMILYTAGACIAYAVLLGDFTTGLIEAVDLEAWPAARHLSTHASAVAWIGLLVLTPLSCVRDLRHLQHSSALALLCDFATVAVILYRSATTPPAPDINWASPPPSIFFVTPIVAVACNTHYNAPKYYQELKGRSVAKMKRLSISAMGLASAIYIAVSVAGYLQFGGATKGDILNCYGATDGLAIAARLCLAVHIALTFPVIFNSTRANIHSLSSAEGDAVALTHRQSALYAFVIVPALVAVAAQVPEVHEVLAFNGALLGSLIVYTFPAAILYSLNQRSKAEQAPSSKEEERGPGDAATSTQLQQQGRGGSSRASSSAADWLQQPSSGRFWSQTAPLICAGCGLVMMTTGTGTILAQKAGLLNVSVGGHR